MQRTTLTTFHNICKLISAKNSGVMLPRQYAHRRINQQSLRHKATASTKNLTAILMRNKEIKCEDREVPKPKKDELLIKVQTVGVCGSDIHFWKTGAIGPLIVKHPFILGHEAAGIVAGVGDQVKGFSVGDRVALEPSQPCRRCDMCRHGHYNLCTNLRLLGVPPKSGSFRQYVTHEADFCFKLPDNMSMEEGALLEPLSVSLYACRDAGVTAASKVLILGSGPIGLLAALGAQAYGATRVCITDVSSDRLHLAKEVGIDFPINVKGIKPDDAAKKIIESLGGPPDMAIECCGITESTETAIKSVKNGGIVSLVALAQDIVPIPILDVVAKEVKLNGVFCYTNTWPMAIDLVSKGRIKLDKITRAIYDLDNIQEAFVKSAKGEVMKVFVKCNKS